MLLRLENYVKKQLIISSCLYIGQILVGFGMGWTAPIIPKLQDPEQSPLPELITETEASLIGSLMYVGTITGPYISGFLSNIVGRKPCLLLGGSISTLAFLVLATANSLGMIYAGRILTGMGTGILFVTNLVYIGEIASTNLRGILLTGTGIFSTFGTLLAYSLGPYFAYPVTGYVGTAMSVLYCIGVLLVPETPLYFMMKGNESAAKLVLNDLGRYNDIDNIANLKNEQEKRSIRKEWVEIFTVKSNRMALFITLTLNILQQLSGIIAVIFFATTIFDLAGSSIEPNLATIIIGLTQIFASCIAPIFVERNGRKILLLVSTAFCCLTLAVLGLYFYLDEIDHASAPKLQWLPLVTLIIFFISYDLGFGIIPGTFIGEMFQSNVRSTGSALTITIGWVFGFGVSTVFGFVITTLGGHVTFWIFSSACAVAFLFTVIFVPETKGKSLAEIQEILNK